jgi:rhamnosyltransferase
VIYSVVVIYNPDESIEDRLQFLSNESDFLVVIVNQTDVFGDFKNQISNADFIILGENIGLAKALNIGIKRCLEDTYCKSIVFFDQDSMPSSNSIKILEKRLESISSIKIASIGLNIVDIKGNHQKIFNDTDYKSENLNYKEVDVIITSGSLIPVTVLKDVGLMDESLFIDYIDYEWCLRAKSKGYKIMKLNDINLYHNMGDQLIDIFGIKRPYHKNESRHFYIIRNQLILINRPYVPLYWKCIHFIKLFYRVPAYIFLSKNRMKTFEIIKNAVYDYFKNKDDYTQIKY